MPDVYTQFRTKVEGKVPVRKCVSLPDRLKPLPAGIHSEDLPTIEAFGFPSELYVCLSFIFPISFIFFHIHFSCYLLSVMKCLSF